MKTFTIRLRDFPSGAKFLKGPRAPRDVARLGYAFTDDPSEAWPFRSKKMAMAKGRIVARHMGATSNNFTIE